MRPNDPVLMLERESDRGKNDFDGIFEGSVVRSGLSGFWRCCCAYSRRHAYVSRSGILPNFTLLLGPPNRINLPNQLRSNLNAIVSP